MIVDQTTFRTAVLNPDAARPDGLTDGHGRAAGRRFDVYRNNVTVALKDALETAFPVIAKLIGEANFPILAAAFLRAHPPSSPLIMFYGAEMPTFLANFEPTKSLGYLPDVARLELALRQSYHAADATPLDPTVLQATPPEQLMASRVTLAKSAKLVRSQWPVHAVWAFNTIPGSPKPQMAAQDTLVLRTDLDPEPHLLPPGAGAFVEALLNDETFAAALEIAAQDAETFDLSQTLALLITNNALIDLKD